MFFKVFLNVNYNYIFSAGPLGMAEIIGPK